MALNDHRALTAEKRLELEEQAAAISFLEIKSPGDPTITPTHRNLVAAMGHIAALDSRALNLATVFRNLQDYVDAVGAVPEGSYVEAKQVADKLNELIQKALASL